MSKQAGQNLYWRGFRYGVEDRRNRRSTGLGPNAPWGNLDYDEGYDDGWRVADTIDRVPAK